MQDIETLRQELDQIHSELVDLFRKRLDLTHQIWTLKKSHGLPLLDPSREEAILRQFDSKISDTLERKIIQNFLRSVLHESKQYAEAKIK